MSEVIKLDESTAEEFAEYGYYSDGGGEPMSCDGHTYTYVDISYNYDDHRWCDTHQVIFERDDNKLFALNYDTGKTENQENGFVYSEAELYEVVKKEKMVTTVSYETVK